MIVVSDTSPVRALVHLGLAGHLAGLFNSVLIPPAVVAELSVATANVGPVDVLPIVFE